MQASRSVRDLSSNAAAAICQAVVAHALSNGLRINVAVVDRGGNLLAFQRMDDAFLHSIGIAQDKAYSAVSFGFPTAKWRQLFAEQPALRDGLLQRPRLVALGGGLPIMERGELIGGIGVSGASEQEDEDCALAGLRDAGLA